MRKSTLTREQVLLAERPAWTRGHRYYYDGINFWKRTIFSEQVGAPRTPAEGWRHKKDCRCEFCRPAEPGGPPPGSAPEPPETPPASEGGEGDLSSGGRTL
jgi:hypothetical protein